MIQIPHRGAWVLKDNKGINRNLKIEESEYIDSSEEQLTHRSNYTAI